jgi:hypothetical protein
VFLSTSISEIVAQMPGRDLWLFGRANRTFLYYLIAWLAIGRELEAGLLVTRYTRRLDSLRQPCAT